MPLFVTSTLPFLGHKHASAVAFMTCRSHNYHGSIIPEFLSDEERVKSFCAARQQNKLEADKAKQYKNLFHLFVQTPLMQFSPSLIVSQKDCNESILKPLLETQYFKCMLQRCSVISRVPLTTGLFQSLSKVRSLIKLDLGNSVVENQHLEIIVNSFPSLETLSIENAADLDLTTTINISSPPPPAANTPETVTIQGLFGAMRSVSGLIATQFVPHFTKLKNLLFSGDEDRSTTGITISSSPPPATKTLRNLTMKQVDALFAAQFVPHFTNLRKLELCAKNSKQGFDLLPFSSSLPLLTDLSLKSYTLKNVESLRNLVHLSSLQFYMCKSLDWSFLSQKTTISPELTTLRIDTCDWLSNNSFAQLANAPNLRILKLAVCHKFNNSCFQYLEEMVHLRSLDLSWTKIVGDSRSLKALMQKLFQLEELNLERCYIGNQGAIAGALYSTHSHLRVLNLRHCDLEDDDLNGIGQLRKTLEVLDLSSNYHLSNEILVHCKELVKLKKLNLMTCLQINDFSPLTKCLNLEELDVSIGFRSTDDEFKIFSEESNSFPNLRRLNLTCRKLTEKDFEHLSSNSNLVFRLEELNAWGTLSEMVVTSSRTARNNLCQLKGLRRLNGILPDDDDSSESALESLELLKRELLRELKNLEGFDQN